jgi:hypothetical protein
MSGLADATLTERSRGRPFLCITHCRFNFALFGRAFPRSTLRPMDRDYGRPCGGSGDDVLDLPDDEPPSWLATIAFVLGAVVLALAFGAAVLTLLVWL